MIRADIGESIPILATLVDEYTGTLAAGETVYYDIRDMSDAPLSPPINGIMAESSVTPGIYKVSTTFTTFGSFVCYTTCSGFLTSTEEIQVNPENIYELIKKNYHYNLSVEDVVRTNVTPTASQIARNVPLGKTDYVTGIVRDDGDIDWSSTTTSGVVYAHYRATTDNAPYKMGEQV